MSQPGNAPWVRLWRIEDERGFGPFVADGKGVWSKIRRWEWCQCEYMRCRDPWDIPTIDFDAHCRGPESDLWVEHFNGTGRFAYLNPRDILQWCGPCYLKAAARADYVVTKYAVPWEAHTRYRHQAIFDADAAVRLGSIGLPELYWS